MTKKLFTSSKQLGEYLLSLDDKPIYLEENSMSDCIDNPSSLKLFRVVSGISTKSVKDSYVLETEFIEEPLNSHFYKKGDFFVLSNNWFEINADCQEEHHVPDSDESFVYNYPSNELLSKPLLEIPLSDFIFLEFKHNSLFKHGHIFTYKMDYIGFNDIIPPDDMIRTPCTYVLNSSSIEDINLSQFEPYQLLNPFLDYTTEPFLELTPRVLIVTEDGFDLTSLKEMTLKEAIIWYRTEFPTYFSHSN